MNLTDKLFGTALLLAACLLLVSCGTEAAAEPIPEDGSETITLRLINTVEDGITAISVDWAADGGVVSTTTVQDAGGAALEGGEFRFALTAEELDGRSTEDLTAVVNVTDTEGVTMSAGAVSLPAFYGDECGYELRCEDGCYSLRGLD